MVSRVGHRPLLPVALASLSTQHPSAMSSEILSQIDQFLESQSDRFEAQLIELLRIPSVSADSQHASDVRQAADWLVTRLAACGLSTELIPTAGYPIVYAESPPVPGKPVALIYGHYDVQPPDPLDEWITPPFEPARRDGNLVARGATDDKGQMLTHVQSVAAWLQTVGHLPIQVKLLIEGEEEVGSENLEMFLVENRERLACDCVVISDTSQFAPGRPAITYGLRGIACYELRLTGPKQDLHSGSFGGAVTNPAKELTRLLASLIDDEGRVQVPGFYDQVEPLSEVEREQWAALPTDEQAFQQQLGVKGLSGERGYSQLEQRWARPTFDINGMWSGYQGEGPKTIIPARAGAKFSFRLVPYQDPAKITAALQAMLESQLPPGVEMELIDYHGAPGFVVPLESPYVQAASRAIEQGFGTRPVMIREGGSIPIVTQFAEQLQAEVLLLGWGQDDDNTHGPNEKFCLADFHRGIRASAHLWHHLAALPDSV